VRKEEVNMRVAIASDDGKTIASHFGRALGFIVYEIEDEVVKHRRFMENTFTGHMGSHRGEGHAARNGEGHGPWHGDGGHSHGHGPILDALRGCDAVISHGMGRRMYADLREVGIEAYVVDETDADEALELYLKKRLTDHPEKSCDH
jgi:predicted Fe-Mo cluster-binding NifX family protein